MSFTTLEEAKDRARNDRPYHNYETWSDGYRANDGLYKVEAEVSRHTKE